MSIVTIIIVLVLLAFFIACDWIIFTKAGKPGWAGIIPIYDLFIYLQIIGKPWYWIILFCIPIVNIVYIIWMLNLISKCFGKTEGFTVGLILLPFIFFPILAFGDAKYVKQAAPIQEAE